MFALKRQKEKRKRINSRDNSENGFRRSSAREISRDLPSIILNFLIPEDYFGRALNAKYSKFRTSCTNVTYNVF